MSAGTVDKFFCAVPIRWGALIIGIVDIVLGIVAYILSEGVNDAALDVIMIVCYFVHMVGCILLIISVFVTKHQLVVCYLITGIIRLILMIVLLVVEAIYGYDLVAMYIIEILILGLGVYFWICAYSWYVSIGGRLFF